MIRLWHVAQSRSFRVLWLLEEIGAEYDLIACSFFDRSLRDADHLLRSPAGRVPAIAVDGQTLCESGAILLYLAENRAPDLRVPEGAAGRAAFLQGLHYAETLGAHLANLTQHHIVLRYDWMRSPTVMRLEAKRLENALRAVGPDWVTGEFTVADIAIGYAVWMARRFVGLPECAARYTERFAARPAFQRALQKDGPAQIYTQDFYAPPEG
ncbi:glutathione S-transferase family protein [Roseinatronobacter alkalisoli]|uniref:Glutathione S-transferase n=1 Tax=Roseinatronobacter alkalisoli TaxID=3028235 RepID=A0ABT5T4S5_9RHOB|nr:glutathione S-transferase [Roseinatronobacter sp. HJB301]MDD7970123.1 glutathione S-transferase [Roseinatronobacter sp. HJB301]